MKPGPREILESPDCVLCGVSRKRPLFSKPSGRGEHFTLVKCAGCGLKYLSPRPTEEALRSYYQSSYFTKRTDRGYDNYFSSEIRAEVTRVLELNLQDLGFFKYEASLAASRRYLDIGCATGYSVLYMKERGWESIGIDIAGPCIRYGRDNLGLDLIDGDYLTQNFDAPFQLISLWATLEHLHRPDQVVRKIHRDLAPGGRVYLSTCRAGGWMRLFGKNWRYYNFPEHLYYFNWRQLARLMEECGFTVERRAFYGSGVGKPGGPLRKLADRSAKALNLGDMVILSGIK